MNLLHAQGSNLGGLIGLIANSSSTQINKQPTRALSNLTYPLTQGTWSKFNLTLFF